MNFHVYIFWWAIYFSLQIEEALLEIKSLILFLSIASSFFSIVNIELECRDETVFLKIEVTLKKVNSHKQYYKIPLIYSNNKE